MKQDLIKDVIQGMLPYLNNAQNEKLQEVLQYTLAKYEVTENQKQEKPSEQDFVELFLSAKRIEGCSEKSLKYYKATIEAMLCELKKDVKHIVTDDIRGYLMEYQEKKKSSKVTIDNIRRILSSFFSWLEDEDYILKSPVRRIHRVKTGTNIKETYSDEALTNVVKSEKFSEILQKSLNAYLNGMLTNEEIIEEMLKLAKQIAEANKEGDELGLTAEELAFYDALTKPQAIKDFYENDELIAITKELADTLRKNRTIDFQKRESARARMRMLIKKLLKKHKYPPEGMEDAVQTVMVQCELWADNVMEV